MPSSDLHGYQASEWYAGMHTYRFMRPLNIFDGMFKRIPWWTRLLLELRILCRNLFLFLFFMAVAWMVPHVYSVFRNWQTRSLKGSWIWSWPHSVQMWCRTGSTAGAWVNACGCAPPQLHKTVRRRLTAWSKVSSNSQLQKPHAIEETASAICDRKKEIKKACA